MLAGHSAWKGRTSPVDMYHPLDDSGYADRKREDTLRALEANTELQIEQLRAYQQLPEVEALIRAPKWAFHAIIWLRLGTKVRVQWFKPDGFLEPLIRLGQRAVHKTAS